MGTFWKLNGEYCNDGESYNCCDPVYNYTIKSCNKGEVSELRYNISSGKTSLIRFFFDLCDKYCPELKEGVEIRNKSIYYTVECGTIGRAFLAFKWSFWRLTAASGETQLLKAYYNYCEQNNIEFNFFHALYYLCTFLDYTELELVFPTMYSINHSLRELNEFEKNFKEVMVNTSISNFQCHVSQAYFRDFCLWITPSLRFNNKQLSLPSFFSAIAAKNRLEDYYELNDCLLQPKIKLIKENNKFNIRFTTIKDIESIPELSSKLAKFNLTIYTFFSKIQNLEGSFPKNMHQRGEITAKIYPKSIIQETNSRIFRTPNGCYFITSMLYLD